jgi:hypothetical protein
MGGRPAGVHSRDEIVYGASWAEDVPVEDIKHRVLDFDVSARIGYRMHESKAGFLGRQWIYMSEGQPPTCNIL